MAHYPNSNVLVETDWLAAHLDHPAVRVVEVDEDRTAYDTSHIPGAIAWHWKDDLHDPIRRDFIDADRLQRLLVHSGVDDETSVILYGGNNNWFAAYAYWLLKYLGFDHARLLNGGRTKWELEGRPLTASHPTITPAARAPRLAGIRRELRAFRDEVLAAAQHSRPAAFVDVRSPQEYRGELLAPPHLPQEQPQVPGHIPGAKNIPWNRAADEDGTFKSVEELAQLYCSTGASPADEIIAYCRIGERSSHTWFVLHELLGYWNARNYDGSWTEYGSLVGVPVER